MRAQQLPHGAAASRLHCLLIVTAQSLDSGPPTAPMSLFDHMQPRAMSESRRTSFWSCQTTSE